jgi:hypothetical protein
LRKYFETLKIDLLSNREENRILEFELFGGKHWKNII